MCSLAGDVMLKENIGKATKLGKCKKCLTEKPVIVLRKIDTYCKSCFLAATVHKFRATLGKYRIIRPNERVLVVYQEGHASAALLHLIHSGLNLQEHKKLRLEPVILYIDDHQNISKEERQNVYTSVANVVTSYNFAGFYTVLEKFMENINNEPECKKFSDFTENFEVTNKYSSRTLYDDSSNVCRRQLILKIAKQLNCRIVFTPETSINVAINILSNISLGRGSHIPLDAGIYDDRDAKIKILQPLRYFEVKEMAFYNVFHKLEPFTVLNFNKKAVNSSVNNLITKFVSDLQENYPSTVKTVLRTGDKLSYEKTGHICTLCKAPVEFQQELSSSEARNFSHWVSIRANDLKLDEYVLPVANNGDNILCYGCRNLSDTLQL